MKDEIRRINKLVAEGKISPEDAADLIDAFYESEREERAEQAAEPQASAQAGAATPPPPNEPSTGSRAPFQAIVDQIEKLTKEGADAVDWKEFQKQARDGARKGLDFLKSGFDDISKGRVNIFGTQESRDVTLPLSIADGKLLKIESHSGDISIVGGFSEGSATAHAKFRGANHEDAKQKASEYTLIIEESEHQVLIRQPEVSGLTVDLELKVEGWVTAEIKAESGDISIQKIKSCRVQSRSGDLELKELSGSVDVTSESGNTRIEHVDSGSISIDSKSGDMKLSDVKGTIKIRAGSGDITLEQCGANVLSLEAISGNVSVDLVEPVNGTVSIRSVSGDASVSIADGSDCRVSLSTLRGDAHCGLELEDQSTSEKRVTGKLGQGTGTLDVSAVTGDVHLELRAHSTANI